VTRYRFDVARAGIGHLTYQLQGREVTQPVPVVKGFNVIELRRDDKPTA
jgi:hypothetical protein